VLELEARAKAERRPEGIRYIVAFAAPYTGREGGSGLQRGTIQWPASGRSSLSTL